MKFILNCLEMISKYYIWILDTVCIYDKLNMTHEKYIEILEKYKDLFEKNIGLMEPEMINNPVLVHFCPPYPSTTN